MVEYIFAGVILVSIITLVGHKSWIALIDDVYSHFVHKYILRIFVIISFIPVFNFLSVVASFLIFVIVALVYTIIKSNFSEDIKRPILSYFKKIWR
jgi:hypothetical protein